MDLLGEVMRRFSLLLPILFLFCQKSSAPKEEKTPPSQITFSLEMEESISGERLYRIYAEKSLLYEEKGEIAVIEPRVYFFTDGRVTSRLTAREGRVWLKSSNLLAKGEVVVATEDSTYLFTDSLIWNNSEQRIETDARVKIKNRSSVLEGEGLIADANLSQITIKSPIEGKSDYEFK